MAIFQSNIQGEGFEPAHQSELSTRKRKRLNIVVWQVWLDQFFRERNLLREDDESNGTAMVPRRDFRMMFNGFVPDLIEFMSRRAHLLATGAPERSRITIREEIEQPTKMLKFANSLKNQIFTFRKITHENDQPLQIQLIDIKTSKICTDPLLVEIVVVDGDYCPEDEENWTSDQFEKSILGPRKQKGPLLVSTVEKKVVKKLENGRVFFDDLVITDNSTLAKNNKFRLGARVYRGPRVLEALTEEFRVKDCRGQDRMKHEKPSPDDHVWRLINIGKNGKYHKTLVSNGIKTVQDFLNLSETDPEFLNSTLGMSQNKLESTLEHAKRSLAPPHPQYMDAPQQSVTKSPTNSTINRENCLVSEEIELNPLPQIEEVHLENTVMTQQQMEASPNLGVNQMERVSTTSTFNGDNTATEWTDYLASGDWLWDD